MNIVVREAKPSEADQLTDLAIRSKTHWGYSQDLIEKWHAELVVTPELIESSISFVVEVDGQIKGFWCRTPKADLSDGRYFIEPDSIGLGYGKLLWDAVISKAKKLKLKYLTWEADPNAIGFYLKMGAKQIGTTNSNIVPGRKIPIMRYHLSRNQLTNLQQFKNKETFIRLYERAFDIESQIQQLDNLNKLGSDVINVLEKNGVVFIDIIFVYTEHIFVLYRSMFQASDWEKKLSRHHISPSAYHYSEELLVIHNEIIDHVDKVLAHQDFNGKQRYLHDPINSEQNGKSYLFRKSIKYHACMLLPHIFLMKKVIKDIYLSKFNEELKLFFEVHHKTKKG